MKKNSIFVCMVVLPLMLAACAKNNLLENEEPSERATMIDPWTAIDQTPYMVKQKGEGVPLVAGVEETKSSMTVDEGHSVATVAWSDGDSFDMYGYNSGYEGATYTTTSGGDKASFTTSEVLPSSPQHSLFAPGSTAIKLGHDKDGCFFGVKIPTEQTAVAGKVKDEYLYSYARTTFSGDGALQLNDNTHNATFHSMLAYVRFRMTGSIVPSVHSVTLRGSSAIAGDCVVIPAPSGTPQISFSKGFTGDASSNTVTLTGTFAAGEYYYFAVAPGTQISLSLVFSDGSSHTTTKISSNSVTFARGQISDIGEIDLGSSFSDPTGEPSMATIKYMSATTTSPTNPVTIAVIPDGFTSSEMYKYELLAKSAINTLFNVEPFKSYKEYFNVYILKVASAVSGARISDGTDAEKTRNCYFKSSWKKDDYDDMCADDATVFSYVAANCPDITGSLHTIDEVPILMIINDARYGGINITYTSGRSYCMAPYTYEGGRMTWPYPNGEATSDSDPGASVSATSAERLAEVGANSGNWLNTMVHEFGGHCFSRLKDEYWYPEDEDKATVDKIAEHNYTVPMGLNISATYSNPGADYGHAGWKHLLDNKETLVANNPLYGRIGVYQGGDVSTRRRWRSERVSCMIDNRFYFSTFQRELIVRRIMTLAGEEFNEASFWAKDVPYDPVRDIVSSPVMGNSDPVVPRPVPMLPPPRIVVND